MGKNIIKIDKNYRKLTVEQSFKLAEEILLDRVCDDYIKEEISKFTESRLNDLRPVLRINIENMFSINTARFGIDGFTKFLVVKFYQRLINELRDNEDMAFDKAMELKKTVFTLQKDFKRVMVV